MTSKANLLTLPQTEDEARAWLEEQRWGKNAEHAACPKCGTMNPYRLTPKATSTRPGRQGLWKCRACRKQFTVTVGTVFESSHIPLVKWLLAIHLLASSKKGMSAHQIHRNLGVTYEAAWFMMHRLRYAAMQQPLTALMDATVEVDETYVGARRKRGAKRGRPGPDSHKTPVVALVERGTGRVRAFPMPRVTSENLSAALSADAEPTAELMTDDYYAYRSVGERQKRHGVVKHSNKEYVRGADHTNTI
jgi:transposase-like protein